MRASGLWTNLEFQITSFVEFIESKQTLIRLQPLP